MTPKTVLKYAIGPIGLGLLGFISVPTVSWFFSSEAIGILALLQVVVGFGLMLSTLGMDQAYAREYHSTEDKPGLLSLCVWPGLLFLCLLFFSIFIFGFERASRLIFGVESSLLAIVAMLCISFAFLQRFTSLILRLQEKPLHFSFLQILPKFLFLSSALVLAFILSYDGELALPFSHLLGLSLAAVFFLFLTRSDWKAVASPKLNPSLYLPGLKYGLPLVLTGIAAWGLKAIDKIFLRSFSSLSELGVYSVAATIAAGAAVLTSVFNTIWAPTVYKWAAQGDDGGRIEAASQIVQFFVMLIFTVGGLFSWLFLYVLPPEYDSVPTLIPACLAPALIYAVSEATTIGINVSRKTSYSIYATVIALIVGVAANWILVPLLGAPGAAISTSIAFLSFLISRVEFASRAWKKIRRTRLYTMTLLVTCVASLHALNSESIRSYISLLWCTFGGLTLFVYRRELAVVWSSRRSRRY